MQPRHGSHQGRTSALALAAASASAFGVATDNDCVVAIRGDAAASVGSATRLERLLTTSVVSSVVATQCAGVCDRGYRCRNLRLGGLAAAGSDPFLLRGASRTVRLARGVSVVDAEVPCVRPPVRRRLQEAPSDSAPSVVAAPVVVVVPVSPDVAAPCASLELAVAGSVPGAGAGGGRSGGATGLVGPRRDRCPTRSRWRRRHPSDGYAATRPAMPCQACGMYSA